MSFPMRPCFPQNSAAFIIPFMSDILCRVFPAVRVSPDSEPRIFLIFTFIPVRHPVPRLPPEGFDRYVPNLNVTWTLSDLFPWQPQPPLTSAIVFSYICPTLFCRKTCPIIPYQRSAVCKTFIVFWFHQILFPLPFHPYRWQMSNLSRW